jgi:hypothetical protein
MKSDHIKRALDLQPVMDRLTRSVAFLSRLLEAGVDTDCGPSTELKAPLAP